MSKFKGWMDKGWHYKVEMKAYVTPSCVLPPSGQTDKLLPAEALTDYTE